MANWFEDVAKTLADDKISRRTALRRAAGGIAGVALASIFPGIGSASALVATGAAGTCGGSGKCPGGGGNCSVGFVNCSNNENTNCYCFTDMNGKGVCGCNTYCSQAPTCTSDSGCAKGSVCITANGCTGCGSSTGVCIPDCTKKKNKNCVLGSSEHAGPVAAPRSLAPNAVTLALTPQSASVGCTIKASGMGVNTGDLVEIHFENEGFVANQNVQNDMTYCTTFAVPAEQMKKLPYQRKVWAEEYEVKKNGDKGKKVSESVPVIFCVQPPGNCQPGMCPQMSSLLD